MGLMVSLITCVMAPLLNLSLLQQITYLVTLPKGDYVLNTRSRAYADVHTSCITDHGQRVHGQFLLSRIHSELPYKTRPFGVL